MDESSSGEDYRDVGPAVVTESRDGQITYAVGGFRQNTHRPRGGRGGADVTAAIASFPKDLPQVEKGKIVSAQLESIGGVGAPTHKVSRSGWRMIVTRRRKRSNGR
ncbi:hypothetical protein ACFLZP_03655 [Patescibacteria group bacterium]